MGLKLLFKRISNPHSFIFFHPRKEHLEVFYDELVNLDNRIYYEKDFKDYINYVLWYDDYSNNAILKFRDCLESMGFRVETKLYGHRHKEGIIFTIYLDNLWELNC